jgi:hypothetical protein
LASVSLLYHVAHSVGLHASWTDDRWALVAVTVAVTVTVTENWKLEAVNAG